MKTLIVLALAGLALALPSVGCSAPPAAASHPPPAAVDPAFGEKVRAYLLEHPEVIQEAIDRLQAKTEAEAAAAAKTAIRDHRAKIERDARDPVQGLALAPITVTEFFDYRCPYCKAAGKDIEGWLAKHKNVRLVFKEFPILSEASEHAARLALAAQLQGRYFPVHLALLNAPTLNDAVVDDILKKNGVDVARAKKDAMSPAITEHLNETNALAKTLAVTGTPSFIIGDQVSSGWNTAELDDSIAMLEKTAPKPAAAPAKKGE